MARMASSACCSSSSNVVQEPVRQLLFIFTYVEHHTTPQNARHACVRTTSFLVTVFNFNKTMHVVVSYGRIPLRGERPSSRKNRWWR
uniref:Uncharacterized protein n=1 Tax=Oryza sativa subsp. japonica TaxID=39947 RepID=Q69JU9_ORYSJ|nr:unknown protein [Oryza sativa Japonica Group]